MKCPDRVRDERGASLALALAFILIFSVGITALLGLASTNLLATNGIAEQRRIAYAADGATDAAIEFVRTTQTQCGFVGGACPSFSATLNGKTGVVTFVGTTPIGLLDRSINLTTTVDGVKRVEASIVVQHTNPAKIPVYVTRWVYFR